MTNMVRRSIEERIAVAAERIADAPEAANAADPLTMLGAALGDAEGPQDASDGADMGPAAFAALTGRPEPREAFASNGQTHIYMLCEGWHIVARRDKQAESGYRVTIERA